MIYPVESFTAAERERLAPHVTDLDAPVFALVNLPETVKGALFARYSRYPGTLRRLFLDEFADDLGERAAERYDGAEGTRAASLYERVFVGYGDDSVAQLGGAHVACEWVSNVLTKVLQRPRLGSYLEQSTRYIAYDAPLPSPPGGYRYYRDAALGPAYERAMDELFSIYASLLPQLRGWAAERFPAADDEPAAAHARAIKAKALDLVRGLLPASSLSHVGIFASGQTYEQLIMHLMAHPLPEARAYGAMILEAVKAVMPSFVARVERPERGGEWIAYLEDRSRAAQRWAERLGLSAGCGGGAGEPGSEGPKGGPGSEGPESGLGSEGPASGPGSEGPKGGPGGSERGAGGPSVTLLRAEGSEADLLAALLFEACDCPEQDALRAIGQLRDDARGQLLRELVGERRNRRQRPGRGFEALRYRFEIVSDYGAFRDLQRHRMLTVQWQSLSPALGAAVPEELALAGAGAQYERALEISRREFERLADAGLHTSAPYALCLGYRIRYILDLNAREAMHLIELRSGREGHPSYRSIAHAMHEQIAGVHPTVAAAMTHVDRDTDPRLERIVAESRARRVQRET